MKIFVDLNKKHLDGKVNINKMEWVKECVRSKKVAMRDVVSLLKNFFCESGYEAELWWWLEKDKKFKDF